MPKRADPVDPKVALDGITNGFVECLGQDQDTSYRKGVLYNELVAKSLALLNGYKTTHDYLVEVLHDALSQSELSRDGRVAAHFTEPQAKTFLVSKLDLWLTYSAEAKLPLDADPAKGIVKASQGDGTFKNKAFPECSTADLVAAIKALKQPKPSPTPPAPSDTAQALQDALDELYGESHIRIVEHVRGKAPVIDLISLPGNRKEMSDILQTMVEHLEENPTPGKRPKRKNAKR